MFRRDELGGTYNTNKKINNTHHLSFQPELMLLGV